MRENLVQGSEQQVNRGRYAIETVYRVVEHSRYIGSVSKERNRPNFIEERLKQCYKIFDGPAFCSLRAGSEIVQSRESCVSP